MKIPHLLFAFSILVLLASPNTSQTIPKCPVVWINGPASDLTAGSPAKFTAVLSELNATARPEYRWEVSAGSIISGHGTPEIVVDTNGLDGAQITATVSIQGVSFACAVEASRSNTILPIGIGCALPFDQYGEIKFADEKARLDNFAIQLSNDKTSTGYIFVYAGQRSYPGEAVEHLERVSNYLVSVRQISPNRLSTIDGGHQEEFAVALIIQPSGAAPPSAMPTLSPAQVELTKTRPEPENEEDEDHEKPDPPAK
jgi:hypothetical protein